MYHFLGLKFHFKRKYICGVFIRRAVRVRDEFGCRICRSTLAGEREFDDDSQPCGKGGSSHERRFESIQVL